jgi:hypothetical protein
MSPSQVFEEQIYRPKCALCKKSVKLEESKTDEYGQAVHEKCYVSKLGKIFAPWNNPAGQPHSRASS